MKAGVLSAVATTTAVLLAAALAAGSTGPPPPGATARCRDGSYSFSQGRGTCSHHGGVAEWLTGSGKAGSIDVGKTVLLAPRTKTSGCRLGANPDRRCSPGAFYSKLTKRVLCSASFRTSSIRDVSESEMYAVEREYGMAPRHYGRALEIDHIVPLELGGSNDIANLFPEGAYADPGYRVKDKLENKLHDLVCAGAIWLRTAQRRIASDWQSLFRDIFGVAPAH